ncbi:hypothetical protein [Occultella kanbiaonis]|uniref:hypothetical protein n=1 Tax=Occultella kanbiaonis TaxID=2675754 RepID=UPI0012B78B18|nr:hypothetical protein [Occultella kanbiaonis]
MPPNILLARDYGAKDLAALRRTGDYTNVRRGAIVRASEAKQTWARADHLSLARCVAVAAELTCSFAFSHESAVLIHGGWIDHPTDVVHISQTNTPRVLRHSDIRRHHASDLTPADVVEVNGLPVTSLERTALDCALSLRPRRALVAVDSLLRLRIKPSRERKDDFRDGIARAIRDLLAELENRPVRRGLKGAREIIRHADPLSESAGESWLRWIALAFGLPRPQTQLRVVTDAGPKWVDMGWMVEGDDVDFVRLGAEYDGRSKYAQQPQGGGRAKYSRRSGDGARSEEIASGDALFHEKVREDSLRRAGVHTERFVHQQLRDPGAAFARLYAAFPESARPMLRPRPALRTFTGRR